MSRTTVRLSAPVVVTIGLLVGCGASHQNPPGPDSHEEHGNPPGPEVEGEAHANPPGHDQDGHGGEASHANPPGHPDTPHNNPPGPSAETEPVVNKNPPAPAPDDKKPEEKK